MEKFLKLVASFFCIILVGAAYPAIAWGLFQKPIFWLLYLLCVIVVLGCIKTIKYIQNKQSE